MEGRGKSAKFSVKRAKSRKFSGNRTEPRTKARSARDEPFVDIPNRGCDSYRPDGLYDEAAEQSAASPHTRREWSFADAQPCRVAPARARSARPMQAHTNEILLRMMSCEDRTNSEAIIMDEVLRCTPTRAIKFILICEGCNYVMEGMTFCDKRAIAANMDGSMCLIKIATAVYMFIGNKLYMAKPYCIMSASLDMVHIERADMITIGGLDLVENWLGVYADLIPEDFDWASLQVRLGAHLKARDGITVEFSNCTATIDRLFAMKYVSPGPVLHGRVIVGKPASPKLVEYIESIRESDDIFAGISGLTFDDRDALCAALMRMKLLFSCA